MSTTVKGVAELSAVLAKGIKEAIPAVLKVSANITQNRLAVYPPKKSSSGRRQWYQRGYGQRWRRKDGSVGGRKTSQTLGRRWSYEPVSDFVGRLENGASYSPWVHSAEKQSGRNAAIGWKTDKKVIEELESDGTYARIGDAAIKNILK